MPLDPPDDGSEPVTRSDQSLPDAAARRTFGRPGAPETVATSGPLTAAPDRPPSDFAGTYRFGSYDLLEQLGKGGMGVVWKARLVGTERLVALKQILANEFTSAEVVERFKVEARAAAGLDHPGIVPVYDIGEVNGRPYYTMPLLDGGSLKSLLADGPLPPKVAALLLRQLAEAVQHAHSRGVIHRDLKPENVLLQPAGPSNPQAVTATGLLSKSAAHRAAGVTPRLTDFGLARAAEAAEHGLTHTGSVLGTPPYMAPEQAAGNVRGVGPLTDVYGLGAVLYCCLTGRPPFHAATVLETLQQVQARDPVPVRRLNAAVPRELETICLKCLEKDPARRYDSAAALADDLRRFADGEAIHAVPAGVLTHVLKWGRRRPAVALLLGLLLLVGGVALGVCAWAVSAVLDEAEAARRERDRADVSAATALGQKDRADAEAQNARRNAEQANRSLYVGQLGWARAELLENNHGGAARVLERTRPDLRGWEYGYLRRCAEGTPLVLAPKAGRVGGVAFGPDGNHLAVAPDDQTVRIYDVRTGRESLTLRGHTARVRAVAYSPGGARLVSGANDATVRLWDAATGECLRTFRGHERAVNAVAFDATGARLATASDDQTVRLWDAASGQRVGEPVAFDSPVNAVAYAPDGSRLAAGCANGKVVVLDAAGKELAAVNERGAVTGLAFGPDGRHLAIAFTRVSKALGGAVVDTFGNVEVRDPQLAQSVRTLTARGCGFSAVAYSPDGAALAAAATDGSVRTWDARSGAEQPALRGHGGGVDTVAFNADGSRLATGSADETARVWDPRARPGVVKLIGHTGGVLTIVVSNDGTRAVTGSNDGSVRVWDARTGMQLFTLRHGGIVIYAAFNPDGTRIVTGSKDGVIRVADARTGAEVSALRGHAGQIVWVTFSPDGTRLASASADKTARLWDVQTRQEIRQFIGHESAVTGVAFTPDGKTLATTSADHTARAWDVETGRCLQVFRGHTAILDSIAVSPDGKILGTASLDQTARLWDMETGTELHRLSNHSHMVTDVAFSPDGKRVVTGSWDRTARIWDAQTGQELLALRGHADRLSTANFSPDGAYVATASWDNTARLWDARTGGEATEPPAAALPKDGPADAGYNLWAEDDARRAARAPAWHAAAATDAERGGDPFAAAFHTGWLLWQLPGDPALHRQRARALDALGRNGEAAAHRIAAALLDPLSAFLN